MTFKTMKEIQSELEKAKSDAFESILVSKEEHEEEINLLIGDLEIVSIEKSMAMPRFGSMDIYKFTKDDFFQDKLGTDTNNEYDYIYRANLSFYKEQFWVETVHLNGTVSNEVLKKSIEDCIGFACVVEDNAKHYKDLQHLIGEIDDIEVVKKENCE